MFVLLFAKARVNPGPVFLLAQNISKIPIAVVMLLVYNIYVRRTYTMKKVMSITIEERLYEILKKQAEEENRSVSNIVETAILKYLGK